MNEHIKELADRMWRIHPNDIDAMGLKTRKEFYEHELKKFTELIVRECAHIGFNAAYPENGVGVSLAIKTHFGVE